MGSTHCKDKAQHTFPLHVHLLVFVWVIHTENITNTGSAVEFLPIPDM